MKNLKDNPDEGFSLLEVVVAILMIFFFTTTALQMLVLSSLFKKQAIQYTTAISLIQQDIEKVKSGADQYSFRQVSVLPNINSSPNLTLVAVTPGTANVPYLTNDIIKFPNNTKPYTISAPITNTSTTVTLNASYAPPQVTISANASVGANTITVSSADNLSTTYNKFLSINSQIYTISGISNKTVTITPNLAAAVTSGTPAYVIPSPLVMTKDTNCNPSSASTGLATLFQTDIGTAATGIGNIAYTVNGTTYYAVTGTPITLKGQSYWLLRNQTVSTDVPYNSLKINYVVQAGNTATPPVPFKAPSPNTNQYRLDPAYTLATSSTEVIPYASFQCPSE